jgi:hypothetical protein
LIKVSIDVAAALRRAPRREFTCRYVVEHVAPALAAKNLKTIHGVAAAAEPQDVDSETGSGSD